MDVGGEDLVCPPVLYYRFAVCVCVCVCAYLEIRFMCGFYVFTVELY